MTKLLKRTVDALSPEATRDVFAWDGELRGFGVRVKPSGVKSYLIQYRNSEGRTRRLSENDGVALLLRMTSRF
ncbi:MAG: DUF4102 domain-containing protein [Proteobacteria bacterium]|nr:DUF4102 domain-containing protein [Pseudomonadota bacterium]